MASETTPTKSDPLDRKSLSWHLLIAALLLVATTGWALYDETYGRRPWKAYQSRFAPTYGRHLESLKQTQAQRETAVRETQEYQQMEAELAEARQASSERITDIDRQLNKMINPRIAALIDTLQVVRSEVTALTYLIEVAANEKKKSRLRERLEEIKNQSLVLNLPTAEGTQEATFDYPALVKEYDGLKARKAVLLGERAELVVPAAQIRTRRNEFLKRHLDGLTEDQVAGLQRKVESLETGIRQIHIADVGLVDRCETCHLAIREPVRLTVADMGGEPAFTSHPTPELLKIHDPEEFGCSPCHGGNGVATTSVSAAHGRYHHWLWPLYESQNVEAGCLQCHEDALQLEYAETLNKGKELFRRLGCWACHPRDGFDTERGRLQAVTQALRSISARRAEFEKTIDDAQEVIDDYDSSDEDVMAALQAQEVLTLNLSGLDTEQQQLSLQQRSLYMERKDVAPNLKDIRAKIKPDWLPVWLRDPRSFRPTTHMPRFRLPEDHLQAVAAFIWQAGLEPRTQPQSPGDPAAGEELFNKRGCLGCHSLGETDEGKRLGGSFSVDLSRVGEKANYDYLVRWIHNPRERTLPFCEVCEKDITEEDYQTAGIPFYFDIDHSHCPVCNNEMQVQNQTIMPSLRLPAAEARDIASYLITLKKTDAVYPQADYVQDTGLYEKGKKLVAHYGCMGCHEIAGTETLDKIGTDLTKEGSKPIERLDFGLLTHEAEEQGWYNHKGFFTRKLTDPSVFDHGKEKEPLDKLRMPYFDLSEDETVALTTFLLGSVESQFPHRFRHDPAGFEKDMIEGWWVLKKYNCIGCHQIVPGRKPPILDLEQYADENLVLAPPSLVGQGARVDPVWLVEFLRKPHLSDTSLEQNGVRPYLDVRMPTFTFSEGEISKLVRFFNAISKQPSPYLQPAMEKLTDAELAMARDAFLAAECLKCHAGGDPSAFTAETIAPSFVLAPQRLKPRWMERWLVDPARLMPGTQMPTGLFEQQGDRWIMTGTTPPSMTDYDGDHLELFVRYMEEFTEEEGRRLTTKEE